MSFEAFKAICSFLVFMESNPVKNRFADALPLMLQVGIRGREGGGVYSTSMEHMCSCVCVPCLCCMGVSCVCCVVWGVMCAGMHSFMHEREKGHERDH